MSDLIAWLRAQLDEDERVARAAAPGPWEYQDIDSVGGGRVCDPTVAISHMHWDTDRVDPRIRRSVGAEEADGTGEHIARHDPVRVLAEVDAKRRILDRYEDALARQGDWEESQTAADICATEYEDWILPLLALPFADREGYRDEWRP